MTKDDLRELLWRAAAAKRGILLRTSDPKKLRELFYPLRTEEPEWGRLQFRIVDHPEGNVVIERKEEE